jgi:hypothetical protein
MRMRTPLLLLALAAAPALADGLHEVSRDGRKTEYDGSLSLSGRFEHRQDAETLDWRGDRICFFPDAAAAAQLPDAAAGRKLWFCFSNNRTAAEQLHLAQVAPAGTCGVTGTATVAISHYVAESGSGDIYDEAWLDHVDRLGDTQPLRCQ